MKSKLIRLAVVLAFLVAVMLTLYVLLVVTDISPGSLILAMLGVGAVVLVWALARTTLCSFGRGVRLKGARFSLIDGFLRAARCASDDLPCSFCRVAQAVTRRKVAADHAGARGPELIQEASVSLSTA